MSESKTIYELDTIIAMADQLKIKATGLRKKLEGFNSPASRKGAKKQLAAPVKAKLLLKRMKHLKPIEES